MRTILRLLLTAVIVMILAEILPGVTVASYPAAILVAIIISLLRFFVKPVLIILTLPITILTMGLFLFVINAIIILLADFLIGGFSVSGFWWALLFSILLSLMESLLMKD